MSKNEMIVNDIRTLISDGKYKPDEKIPSEQEMVKTYKVSRATVKKAIDILVADGLIYKIRGSGTYVKKMSDERQKKIIASSQMDGFSSAFDNHDDIQTTILHFEIIHPSKTIASHLNISEQDLIYDIKRMRAVNNDKYLIENIHMPINIVPGITIDILQDSIFKYINNSLSLTIHSVQRVVRASLPTLEEIKLLDIPNNVVILEVEQVGYLKNGVPFEYTIVRHRSDKHEEFYVSSKD